MAVRPHASSTAQGSVVTVSLEPAPASQHLGTVRNFVRNGSRSVTRESDCGEPADRLQTALRRMPKAGDEFGGFQLVRELGRGSFGRVFLATQPDLGGRTVALKVSADLTGESRTLAQLQHTNIVPVYSVHSDGVLQAVCMPYFGATTLADLIRRCRTHPSLPATGMDLVNTIRGMADETTPDSTRDVRQSEQLTNSALARATADARTEAVFSQLSRLSYTQAVCWLIARVADGLAHAHDRGILHRDVKPANVLVTDDGQPMLLDFGVAEDLSVRATAAAGRVGGTVPYMAPEHLDEVRADTRLLDQRSDLYSLGVILYELLTGKHPFRTPTRDLNDELTELIAERRAWVPDVRANNPDVPADLESIVRKCVAADPADRFQSASDLRDDLERHLCDEPLQVAAEPSIRTRMRKWRKRHPRVFTQLAVAAGVVTALTLSVGSIAAWKRMDAMRTEQARLDEQRVRELAGLQAERSFDHLQTDLRYGRYLLTGQRNDPKSLRDGIDSISRLLTQYGVTDNPNWDQAPVVTALPDEKQQELRRFLSDACLFLARGHMKLGDDRERFLAAARFNTLAETVRGTPAPKAVLTQRADLHSKLSDETKAREATKRAEDVAMTTADDYCLSANELSGAGKHADAIPLFRKAVRLDPTHFWSHFGLAFAYQETGRLTEARASYGTAIALRSDFAWSYFNRAMAALIQRAYDDAVGDLDAVIELKPDCLPAYLHRGQALSAIGNHTAALRDLDVVLDAKDTGGLHGRAYLMRAKVKWANNDTDGAKADTEAGLKITPTDDSGWLVRAHARMESDPKSALADLDQAVKLSPNSVPIRQNQAYLLDKLERNEECLVVMNKLIELAPTNVEYRSGRAVLLARLMKYDDALKAIAMELTNNPPHLVRYQAACVYALASRAKPSHKDEAIRVLAAVIRDGFTADDLATDKDFDPIRHSVEFQKLLPTKK